MSVSMLVAAVREDVAAWGESSLPVTLTRGVLVASVGLGGVAAAAAVVAVILLITVVGGMDAATAAGAGSLSGSIPCAARYARAAVSESNA